MIVNSITHINDAPKDLTFGYFPTSWFEKGMYFFDADGEDVASFRLLIRAVVPGLQSCFWDHADRVRIAHPNPGVLVQVLDLLTRAAS
jgi:hypothetical protein